MSLNHVSISGNLGSDSELRATRAGTKVLTFSLAVNERVKQQDGEWADRTNWIDCVLFGRRAEALAPWLKKGDRAAVHGKLRASTYERGGRQVKRVEVVADDIELMNYRRDR